jgi:hypothetical protein
VSTSTATATYTDLAGARIEIPRELIDLRRQWVRAEQRHERLRGSTLPADELIDRRAALQAEMRDLVERIRAHGWWARVDSPYRAERALWAAAERLERLAADVRDPATPPAARPA